MSDGAGQPVSRYLLTALDVGKRVRLVVEARNPEGAAEAVSAETELVAADPGAAPENTARPSVLGLAEQGELLSAQPGAWVGAQPLVYGYRWQRCAPAAYRSLVLSDGPAHYWRLGELDLWAQDEVGGKTGLTKSGVLRGFAGAIAGDADFSSSFDGFDDWIDLPAPSIQLDTGDFTVEGWLLTPTLADQQAWSSGWDGGPVTWNVALGVGGLRRLLASLGQRRPRNPAGRRGRGSLRVFLCIELTHATHVSGQPGRRRADSPLHRRRSHRRGACRRLRRRRSIRRTFRTRSA